jgi:hypothetical protein
MIRSAHLTDLLDWLLCYCYVFAGIVFGKVVGYSLVGSGLHTPPEDHSIILLCQFVKSIRSPLKFYLVIY